MPRWLRGLGWFGREDRELTEEMELHLELEAERLASQGVDPQEARHQARRRFGNRALAAENSREVWSIPPLDTWLRDVGLALRSFARSPLLSLVAVVTLALGLGATGSAFVLVDALLLSPLPVENPHRLVLMRWTAPDFPAVTLSGWVDRDDSGAQWTSTSLPEPGFRALAASRTLEGVAAFAELPELNVISAGETDRSSVQAVSGTYFDLLGVQSAAGRLLSSSDDRAAAPPVAVLDHAYWRTRFGGDRRVVGQSVHINGQPFTVVGIVEPGFHGTLQVGSRPILYVPLATQPLLEPTAPAIGDDANWWLHVLGRRRDDVSLAAVDEEIRALFAGYLAETPVPETGERVPVRLAATPGAYGLDEVRRGLLQPLLLLQGLLVMVLLVASVNVGNLLLARSAARRHEMATRQSVGAGRLRLVRQLLTESVTLALLGGLGGATLLLWLPPMLAATLPDLAGADLASAELSPARGVAAVVAAAVACGLLLGLAPALRATRSGLEPLLTERGAAPGSGRLGPALIAVQVALSLVVVAAAALLGRTLWNLEHADLGFEPKGVLLVQVDAGGAGYEGEVRLRLYARALEALDALPGVRSAALSRNALLSGRAAISELFHSGVAGVEAASLGPIWRMTVSDGFFSTLGVPIVTGRGFDPGDDAAGRRVAIVNREAMRRYFDGANPVGRQVTFSEDEAEPVEIVGVAGDTLYDRPQNGVRPMIYLPWEQDLGALGTATFALATEGPPLALGRPARSALAGLDADLPVFGIQTQQQLVDGSLLVSRRLAQLAALLALLALLLASIGVYGVTAYGVVQRRPEIGIRMALGSERARVVWLVLRGLAVSIGAGLAIGIGGAVLGSRFLADRLFEVAPTDPVTLATGAAVLAAAALIAAVVPARQAARIDPVEALNRQ